MTAFQPPPESSLTSVGNGSVPSAETYGEQHLYLDSILVGKERARSVVALQTYFNENAAPGQPYTGRGFERFAGGGDAESVRDQVTPEDVLSLTFLSITDGLPGVAIDATVTYAEQISALLRQIPADLAMHDAAWGTYADGSAATELWRLLCSCGGKHRPITANKLLARKRPHLLPVYDSQVEALLGKPENFWACLWTWFARDSRRVTTLAELRGEAGGIDDISLLRCLDVILWMHATNRG